MRAPLVPGLPGVGADQEAGLGMFSHHDGLLGDDDGSSRSGQDRSPDYALMLDCALSPGLPAGCSLSGAGRS